jgi:hypothetical protein
VVVPIILAFARLRQEECKFKTIQDHIARPCLKKRTKTMTSQKELLSGGKCLLSVSLDHLK